MDVFNGYFTMCKNFSIEKVSSVLGETDAWPGVSAAINNIDLDGSYAYIFISSP